MSFLDSVSTLFVQNKESENEVLKRKVFELERKVAQYHELSQRLYAECRKFEAQAQAQTQAKQGPSFNVSGGSVFNFVPIVGSSIVVNNSEDQYHVEEQEEDQEEFQVQDQEGFFDLIQGLVETIDTKSFEQNLIPTKVQTKIPTTRKTNIKPIPKVVSKPKMPDSKRVTTKVENKIDDLKIQNMQIQVPPTVPQDPQVQQVQHVVPSVGLGLSVDPQAGPQVVKIQQVQQAIPQVIQQVVAKECDPIMTTVNKDSSAKDSSVKEQPVKEQPVKEAAKGDFVMLTV